MWLNVKIHNLFVNSLSFSTFIVMLFANRDSLLLYQFLYLSFLIFIAVTRTLNKILNRIVESRHHCLLLNFSGETSSVSLLRVWGFHQFSSVAQSCLTLCNPMDCSTPGLPVHHQLPKLAQTHVHQVSDAIQPSHPLLSSSSPAFTLSQPQGLFQWVSCLQTPKYWSFSFSISPFSEYSGRLPLGLTGLISLQSKGLSRVFSNTTVQKHQFFGA